MAVPNCLDVVQRVAAEYPQEFREAHTGGPNTEKFIRRLAWVLYSQDKRWGLNGKRGDYNTISQDALNYFGEGPGTDPKTGSPITVVDVIGGAGGPNPQPSWQVFSDLPGPGGWIKPEPVGSGSADGGTPSPTSPQTTGPDLKPILDAIKALDAKIKAVDSRIDNLAGNLSVMAANAAAASYEALNAASRASEIKTQIENLPKPGGATAFPRYRGKFLGAAVTLDPEPK